MVRSIIRARVDAQRAAMLDLYPARAAQEGRDAASRGLPQSACPYGDAGSYPYTDTGRARAAWIDAHFDYTRRIAAGWSARLNKRRTGFAGDPEVRAEQARHEATHGAGNTVPAGVGRSQWRMSAGAQRADLCTECGASEPRLIGCPSGAEVCPDCFDKGAR